jgi:hypothetical protein
VTREDLQRCGAELGPIVPRGWACPLALEQARAFNERAALVRGALFEPARDLLARDRLPRELPACLEKAVAELAFWRRVLVRLHGAAFEPEEARPDYLLRYVTS